MAINRDVLDVIAWLVKQQIIFEAINPDESFSFSYLKGNS